MLDRRKQQRWPAYLGGSITFSKRLPAADCIVRNTSESGARLELQDTPLLPDEFDLFIPQWHAEYRMRVNWRRNGQVGVEMADAPTSEQPTSLAQARRLMRLERENKSLRHRLALSDLE